MGYFGNMKRSLLLVGIALCLGAAAQPTIHKNLLPAMGTIYGYHDVPFQAPGRPGTGLKWDFSGAPDGAVVPYYWTSTNMAPGAGAFPDGAAVLQVPGEPAAYYQMGDTALLWLGTYADTALVRFDPPMAIVDLPCSINSTWSDSGIAAVTGAGRIDIRVTSLHAQADAWGTLVMPYGTVDNVLRVRSELTATDKFPPHRLRLHEVRYAWYSARSPMPLLIVVERTGWPPPQRFMRWLDGSWQDDPGKLFKPLVLHPFPDPCDEIVTVDLPAAKADRTILQLLDEQGNARKQWPVEFNSPQTRRMTLEMSEVPSGNYTLNWIGSNGTLGNARLEKR